MNYLSIELVGDSSWDFFITEMNNYFSNQFNLFQ